MNPDASPDVRQAQLRSLPSVDELLRQPLISSLLAEFPRGELLFAVRGALDVCRAQIRAGSPPPSDLATLALAVRETLHRRSRPGLRRMINATGIVLHTGLGRAPLAPEALEAVADVASGYSNLEIELDSGQRGDRQDHVRALLRELTGAEDALVVNNNAAATWLALNTLAATGDVLVSRGQLVEIGGSYRMPDIMAAAGCRLVEVGTTNRTRIDDYRRAITGQTRVLLHVHTSNYRIQGFVESVAVGELAHLAREARSPGLYVVDDLGSGLLDLPGREHPTDTGLPPWDEPTVRASLEQSADIVLFSGDKLLGGPQAGVILGRRDLIARLRENPLMRALRPGKLTLAALEATLRLDRDPDVPRRLPTLRLLTTSPAELEAVARRVAEQVRESSATARVEVRAAESLAGGGALPILGLPTWVVTVAHPRVAAAELAHGLRSRDLPVIGRVSNETLVLDCRTLLPGDVDDLSAAVCDVLREADERGV